MTFINTNISALISQTQLQRANEKVQVSMERLTTAKRINSAKDDAAGLAITDRMTADIKAMQIAIRNSSDGISMMQTAEGNLKEVTKVLQRMRQLALQAANGTMSQQNRNALQVEFAQMYEELDKISKSAVFNGVNLLDGSTKMIQLQSGINAGDKINLKLIHASTSALGLSGQTVGGTITTGRVKDISNISKNDILFNNQAWTSQDAPEVVEKDYAKELARLINTNRPEHQVSAKAYNSIKGRTPAGTAFSKLVINDHLVGDASTTQELVKNINRDVPGVTATLTAAGTVNLSNDTGEQIKVGAMLPDPDDTTDFAKVVSNSNVETWVANAQSDNKQFAVDYDGKRYTVTKTGGTTPTFAIQPANSGLAVTWDSTNNKVVVKTEKASATSKLKIVHSDGSAPNTSLDAKRFFSYTGSTPTAPIAEKDPDAGNKQPRKIPTYTGADAKAVANYAGFPMGTHQGFVALTSEGPNRIVVKANVPELNLNGQGTLADIDKLGLSESNEDNAIQGNYVNDARLTNTDTIKIQGVRIPPTTDGSALSKAYAINRVKDKTGVIATAMTNKRYSMDMNKMAGTEQVQPSITIPNAQKYGKLEFEYTDRNHTASANHLVNKKMVLDGRQRVEGKLPEGTVSASFGTDMQKGEVARLQFSLQIKGATKTFTMDNRPGVKITDLTTVQTSNTWHRYWNIAGTAIDLGASPTSMDDLREKFNSNAETAGKWVMFKTADGKPEIRSLSHQQPIHTSIIKTGASASAVATIDSDDIKNMNAINFNLSSATLKAELAKALNSDGEAMTSAEQSAIKTVAIANASGVDTMTITTNSGSSARNLQAFDNFYRPGTTAPDTAQAYKVASTAVTASTSHIKVGVGASGSVKNVTFPIDTKTDGVDSLQRQLAKSAKLSITLANVGASSGALDWTTLTGFQIGSTVHAMTAPAADSLASFVTRINGTAPFNTKWTATANSAGDGIDITMKSGLSKSAKPTYAEFQELSTTFDVGVSGGSAPSLTLTTKLKSGSERVVKGGIADWYTVSSVNNSHLLVEIPSTSPETLLPELTYGTSSSPTTAMTAESAYKKSANATLGYAGTYVIGYTDKSDNSTGIVRVNLSNPSTVNDPANLISTLNADSGFNSKFIAELGEDGKVIIAAKNSGASVGHTIQTVKNEVNGTATNLVGHTVEAGLDLTNATTVQTALNAMVTAPNKASSTSNPFVVTLTDPDGLKIESNTPKETFITNIKRFSPTSPTGETPTGMSQKLWAAQGGYNLKMSINNVEIPLLQADPDNAEGPKIPIKDLADLVKAIKDAGVTGITAKASKESGELELISDTGQNISVKTWLRDPDDTKNVGTAFLKSSAGDIAIGETESEAVADITRGRLTLQSETKARVRVEGSDLDLQKLGISSQGGNGGSIGSGMTITDTENIDVSIKRLDFALNKVGYKRAEMGAVQNRLMMTISNLQTTHINTQASRSRIMDTDFSHETQELTKNQILTQASSAMLAQAKKLPKQVMQLIRD